jgi:dTDP-4-amino-4,6-dideoxygalactose transaminase
VCDPIHALDLVPTFYRLSRSLRIDADDVERQLESQHPKLLVLIHYFGKPDPLAPQVAAIARDHDVAVLEDEAHALLTDLVAGTCGRLGMAALFSMHKLLPVQGGALLLNHAHGVPLPLDRVPGQNPAAWDFDLNEVAARRVANWRTLVRLLGPLMPEVEPLWPDEHPGHIPQSFPVLIGSADRNAVYHAMNDRGFGVTSLYHTLVSDISRDLYPDAHWLARRILNLPLHQDAKPESLVALVRSLSEVVRRTSR